MADGGDDIVKPTRQRMRRAPGYDELSETTPGGITRKSGAVRVWSNLEDLYRKQGISSEEFEAGRKYWMDHELAGFSPRVTSRMQEWIQNGGGGQGSMDAAERRVFHQKRYAQANDILEEIGCRKAMHWFICDDLKLEDIGRKFWGYSNGRAASASARATAALALRRLAKFYGLLK